MQRPRQHEIDAMAQQLLSNAIEPRWVLRQMTPDYGLDYQAEYCEDGVTTGLDISLQLKGQERARFRNECLVLPSFSVKHLIYYLDDVRPPVFIVAADLHTERVFYLPVQQYLWSLPTARWRNQKTLSLLIPRENDATNHARLLADAKAADASARDRWSTPQGAIAFEQCKLEKLDPRIKVEITASASGQHVELHPTQAVEAKLQVKLPRAEARKLLRGDWAELEKGQFTVSGSPLLKMIAEDSLQAKGVMRWANTQRACLRLHTGDPHRRVDLWGSLHRGIAGLTIEAAAESGILEGRAAAISADAIDGTLRFDVNKWAGRRLLDLPGFDEVHPIAHWCTAEPLRFEVFAGGNRLFGGTAVDSGPIEHLESIRNFVAATARSRSLARILGIDPVIPLDDFGILDDAETLANLLDGQFVPIPAPSQCRIDAPAESTEREPGVGESANLERVPGGTHFQKVRFGQELVEIGQTILVAERFRIRDVVATQGRWSVGLERDQETAVRIGLHPDNPLLRAWAASNEDRGSAA